MKSPSHGQPRRSRQPRRLRQPRQPRRSRHGRGVVSMAAFALLSLVSLAMTACVAVDGGAVEFSWTLLSFEDQPIANGCTGARIEEIRLHWEAAPGNPDGNFGTKDFQCKSNRGVTDFEIAEGNHLLWVEPICANDRPATVRTYEVPAPITRTMRLGEVATLNSLLIVADDSSGLDVELLDCTCCSGSF